MPLMIGPQMNPNPNAIPISPILRERSSGGVMSAMYAWATVIFPPQMPANTREMSSTPKAAPGVSRPDPNANRTYDNAAPAVLTSRMGRLP